MEKTFENNIQNAAGSKAGKKKNNIFKLYWTKCMELLYGALKQASEIEIVLTILYKKESKTTPKEQ